MAYRPQGHCFEEFGIVRIQTSLLFFVFSEKNRIRLDNSFGEVLLVPLFVGAERPFQVLYRVFKHLQFSLRRQIPYSQNQRIEMPGGAGGMESLDNYGGDAVIRNQ